MSADVHWASGWYRRRRHVPQDTIRGDVPSLCSPYTRVYPRGGGAPGYPIPLMDSPEVMALPACSHCERLAAKAVAS